MIKQEQILDEKNKILRNKSKDVFFPLDNDTLNTITDAINYLRFSQDEEYAKKYDIRPGMGLSLVQIGIPKKIFVISYKKEDGTFDEYTIINPKIISSSEEMVYIEEGEGCLSVNRNVEGIVPRHARINVEYNDINGNKQIIRVREEIAVAFQHEIDHLNGILFVDRIDKKDPNKNIELYRAI